MEYQNLHKKLNAEWDTERITGTAETAWEKVAVGKKTETAKTTAQTEKRTVEMWKRMINMWKTAEETQKTAVVNKWESLYQNRHNTRQMDGRMILYNL
jgi:hypothetical protein